MLPTPWHSYLHIVCACSLKHSNNSLLKVLALYSGASTSIKVHHFAQLLHGMAQYIFLLPAPLSLIFDLQYGAKRSDFHVLGHRSRRSVIKLSIMSCGHATTRFLRKGGAKAPLYFSKGGPF